jgi:O-methyltransferase
LGYSRLMRPPLFRTRFFWGVREPEPFLAHLEGLFGTLKIDSGVFASDSLIVWGRNLGFLDDEAFVAAYQRNAQALHERGILWRTATVIWAARQAARREGGFVELGCYAGTTARILVETVDLGDRPYYLYDLFEHEESHVHHAMPEHGPGLFERVKTRFEDKPNVHVIRGFVPDSFEQGVPDKIAFAHIDMNNAQAELGALEALKDRFVPGAILLFDDFGQIPYREQHLKERAWFAERGIPILELPTGQGLVIW